MCYNIYGAIYEVLTQEKYDMKTVFVVTGEVEGIVKPVAVCLNEALAEKWIDKAIRKHPDDFVSYTKREVDFVVE